MISEDNPNSSSSKLLEAGLLIEFTDGSGNFKNHIKDRSNLIVFYDCNPKNKILFDSYTKLKNSIDPCRNIHIFPIICIEYFIIKALVESGYKFEFKFPWMQVVLDHVLRKQLIKNMPPRALGYKGSNRNFEQFCKVVLDNAQDEIHNVNIKEIKDKNEGSYYIAKSKSELYEKLIPICLNMPCCVFKENMPSGFRKVVDYHKIIRALESDYLYWEKSKFVVTLEQNWWEKY